MENEKRWFFDNVENTNKIATEFSISDKQIEPTDFGSFTMKVYGDIDKAKPRLKLINKNKDLFSVIQENMEEYSRQDLNTDKPDQVTYFTSDAINFNDFMRVGILLPYISSVAKCLSKYQNIPKYEKSEDFNIEEESKYFSTVLN